MATKFKREPKEKTTEPSVDEVGHGMKKGGHAHKKHMMMGGAPMGATPMVRPRTRMAMAAAAPTRAPMMRKHGGEVESKAEHKAEMHEMHKMEKELKHHEHMPASKAHRGLKKGGIYKPTPGGLLEEGKPHHKAMTGAVEGPGYKHGGHTKKHHKAVGGVMSAVHEGGKQLKHGGHAKHHMAKGGTLHPHIDVQDKVVEAKQRKSISSKTGALEGVGYKHGGHTKKHHYAKGGTVSQNVAKRYENTMVHDGVHSPMQKKAGTGEIKQVPAGYKKGGHVKHHAHGGHVAHHTTHGHGDHGHTHMHQHMAKHDHGHDKMDGHPMKHGGKAHHTSKVSTHHKKGGKCNY
jgi:hypothetical protein